MATSSRPRPQLEINLIDMFTTSKDLRVEAEENGVASRMVKGEEHLLIASQAGAFLDTELFSDEYVQTSKGLRMSWDKRRHLLTRQHLINAVNLILDQDNFTLTTCTESTRQKKKYSPS